MTDQTPFVPVRGPRLPDDREMIPKVLLKAMAALVVLTLALVTFAVVTDRSHVGVPAPSREVAVKEVILEGLSAQSVTIRNPDGSLIADLPHGGFITVIQNGLARERLVHRIDGNPPIRIVKYENGRLVAEDPATGWSAELYAFGGDNRAAFERLMSDTTQ
jgi:putative photosynthetic complex assembly protein